MSQNPNILNESRKRPAENYENEDSSSSKIAVNRDFLGEFRKVQAEADEVKNVLISKTAHLNSSIMNSGIFGEIMRELKTMRTEIKENQERNDKKFEGIQRKMEENEKKAEEKLSEYQNKMLEEIKKLQDANIGQIKVPIRQALVGEWKMIEHENFEGFKQEYRKKSFEKFSKNLKFELIGGKLKQSGAGYGDMTEKEGNGKKLLYVDGPDHLKSIWGADDTQDYFIENGKLHIVENKYGEVWKRIYEKI